jgi:hypothetical protein
MVLETVERARYRPSGLIEFRQTGTGIGVQNGPDLISFYEKPGKYFLFTLEEHCSNLATIPRLW